MLVFIGSSKEAIHLDDSPVDKVTNWIKDLGHVPLRWDDSHVFPPGSFLISRILEVASDVDAAIFICTEDDAVWYHDDITSQPRDNVLIEIGIFSHALGYDRVIACKKGNVKYASDLQGIIYLEMDSNGAQYGFASGINAISTRSKSDSVIDENHLLLRALKETTVPMLQRRSRGKKDQIRRKKRLKLIWEYRGTTLLEVVQTVILSRRMNDWLYLSAGHFMDLIDSKYPKIAEDAYWWMIVYGVLRFRSTDQFWDEDDRWNYSVEYAIISERGKAFFSYLYRRHLLQNDGFIKAVDK